MKKKNWIYKAEKRGREIKKKRKYSCECKMSSITICLVPYLIILSIRKSPINSYLKVTFFAKKKHRSKFYPHAVDSIAKLFIMKMH